MSTEEIHWLVNVHWRNTLIG